MIRQYKQHNCIDTFEDNGLVYEASKNNKQYLLYQFDEYSEIEQYSFKVLKKIMSSKILAIVQEFQEEGTHYVVTDYASGDLLKTQISQPNSVFPLPVALDYFSKIILGLEQLHDNKLIYRNIRPQTIKVQKTGIYFYNFTLSQFSRRKQRIFQIVGCLPFLAPQFFTEDGCGRQVDIWACGVLLFFMLFHEYPFNPASKNQQSCLAEYKNKCLPSFDFAKVIESCKNPGYIKPTKAVEDFFRRIFQFDYSQRITLKQIKKHKLFDGYFPQKIEDSEFLQAIGQQESMLISKFLTLKDFKCAYDIEKQQFVFEFIERFTQNIMIDFADVIPEEIRFKVQFSIAKVAIQRLNHLQASLFGKQKPYFKVDPDDWQNLRGTTAIKKVIDELERQKKRLLNILKSSLMQLPEQVSDFYKQEIPMNFEDIKIQYRNSLSSMFEIAKSKVAQSKSNKPLLRKLNELLAKIIIFHFINHIFNEENIEDDFSIYVAWNKSKNLQNLDSWINSEKVSTLRQFFKNLIHKYQ